MARDLREKFKNAWPKYSNRVAIRHKKDGQWADISYGEFKDDVGALSAFLSQEGVRKDDKIAILLENRPEWPVVFFAAVSIGAVVVPLDPGTDEKEIERILRDSGCAVAFTSDGPLLEKISSARPDSLKTVVSVDSETFRNALKPREGLPGAETEILPQDPACILYTSGTTGEPKGVVLSHRNLLSNSEFVWTSGIFTDKDRMISVLPLHHAYPLMVTMLVPLLHGGTIVYPESMRTEALFEAMEKGDSTFFVGVPRIFYLFCQNISDRLKKIPPPFKFLLNTTIEVLYKVRNKTGLNLAALLFRAAHRKFGKHMRLFVSGGAKLDEDAARTLFKFGFTILEGYGITETSPVLTINPFKKPKIGSVGPAVPGVEIRIKDKDRKGVGEVVVRGQNVMEGYYRREDLTREAIKDGWFYTGDLGYIDEDGYLFLTGRSKELIVLSSGLNIYPEEIEAAYSEKAPIKEMCVLEIPAARGAEENLVLWAVVVPDLEYFRKYAEINLRDVIKERFDNVSRILPPHKRIMGFHITLDELPRTVLGKIKRFAVKEAYTPGVIKKAEVGPRPEELSKEDAELMGSGTGKKITGCLAKQTGVKRAITPADLLELDLGIDSLGRIELASALEQIFNMEIKDEIIGGAFTVRDLITGVKSLLREGMEALSAPGKAVRRGPEYWRRLFQTLPRKQNLDKIDLSPGFGTWLGCFVFTRFVYVFFRMFSSLKVEGKDNFPKTGPYILYGNHTSYFDGLLVGVSVPRFPRLDLFFVGFRPYFDVPIIRNLVKIGRIIPLDFSSHLLEAMRSCYYVLKNGKNLCLFPEGMRTLDGEIGEFKKGLGILAKETKAKLVPVILEGAYQTWPRTSRFPKRHPINVRFGEALDPGALEEEGHKLGAGDSYEAICLGARDALIRLKEKR